MKMKKRTESKRKEKKKLSDLSNRYLEEETPRERGTKTATLPIFSFLEICIYQPQIFVFSSYIYIYTSKLIMDSRYPI